MRKIKKYTFISSVSTMMLLASPAYALEFPGLIQAEDSTSNVGTSTETTRDIGGGLNVGRINPGNSLSYSVDVQTAGTYQLDLRVATIRENSEVRVSVDGRTIADHDIPTTGDWQRWETIGSEVELDAGTQTITLTFDGDVRIGLGNINWLEASLIEAEGGRTVVMQKQNTNFSIDGNNGARRGQQIYLYDTNLDNVNQQWVEIDVGSGFYSYQKFNTSLCLDGGNGADFRQPVTIETCNNTNRNQHWRQVSLANGNFRLEKRGTNFSIDGNHGAQRRQVAYLWESNNNNVNQQWQFFTTTETRAPSPTPTPAPSPSPTPDSTPDVDIIPASLGGFVHPGITHKLSDLDRMKYMVEARIDPWYSSYKEMEDDRASDHRYDVQGRASNTLLARDSPRTNLRAWDNDIRAAYYNAIRWYVTGDARHAEKAIEIFRVWSNLTSVTSNGTDALSGGIGYIMIEAAEIIKSTYDGWSDNDLRAFQDMLVYPGYSTTSVPSGDSTFYWKAFQGDAFRHGNQGLSGWRTVMAMGIFLDNEIMYDRALRYVKGQPHRSDDLPYPGGGNVSTSIRSVGDYLDVYNVSRATNIPDFGYNEVMTHYIYESGQCQESARDQQHTVFGLGLLTSMSEMSWNQGEDLYGHEDSRLLTGLEYNMRYNVSEIQSYPDQPNPWEPTVSSGEFEDGFDRTGRFFSKLISPTHRGGFLDVRPVFEMPVAHYLGRGIKSEDEVRWTVRARDVFIDRSGFEQAGHSNDAIGWGALTARRPELSNGDPIQGFDSGNIPRYGMNVLPTTIEAENFDYFTTLGQGKTYSDNSVGNASGVYRRDESVDIGRNANQGFSVESMAAGEWLNYTVAVPNESFYDITIRYSAAQNGGQLQIDFDGDDKTGVVSLPSTGSVNFINEAVIARGVRLSAGVQSMRVFVRGNSNVINMDSILIN